MLINMSPCGPTLEEQLSSIMDVLAKAAVSEISQLFSGDSATLRLQITRSLKENQALRMRNKAMRSKLLSLRLQARSNASCAARRFALARANICKPQTKPLGNDDCDDLVDRSTQREATSESLYTPGSSLMSSHSEELRILSVYGKGEGPLALDSLPADHCVVKGLERGEQLVRREEPTVQTPDTISIKDGEDIGGGMPAVEDCDDLGDCSTQHGATMNSLHVDAPGSSHMSSHSMELRILSVHGKGESPLALDGHDTLFTVSKLEALDSLSADHSVVKSLEHGEQLVRRKEPTVQQTPDTILIKVEEDIGGGMPAVEDCHDFGDCSTQHRKGEDPLAVGGHDNLFTVFKPEAPSSLSAEQSVAKSLEHRGGGKHRPGVLSAEGFPDNSNVNIHMRTHTGKKSYGCNQCKKRFQQTCHLKSHMRTHSGEKPYRCDQCMKRFQQTGHLKSHMLTHSGEKPYSCNQCLKCFGHNATLKTHMRTHSGEKPYSCNQCVKRFSQSSDLKKHMRTHSGEKPYRCDQCVKSCSQSCNLKVHMRTHSGEKPYSCNQCMKCFGQSSHLKKHMRTHSGEKP